MTRAVSSVPLRLLTPPSTSARAERIEPEISDSELVERLASGDQWAKEALYRRYVRLVWTTALRLLGHRADAEDVVQDTFTEALRDLARLRAPDALRPWLLQIVVHQAHRRFRRRSLLRRFGLDRAAPDSTFAALVHPGARPEVHVELTLVDRALSELAATERFAWVLRHVEGYSLEEVASLSACSLATAKRRIARASECVERHLGDTDEPEEVRHD